MICDAHIHVGYFPRLGYQKPFYYSPRRMVGILNRCGVDEFIFSSTNAIWDESGDGMHREAHEILRLAGKNAHPFFWCTLEYFQHDPHLSNVPDFYQGLKIHGGESPWLKYPPKIQALLAIAVKRGWAVQIHTDKDAERGGMADYERYCRMFPLLRFDFAHGSPYEQTIEILKRNHNLWVDTAFVPLPVLSRWLEVPEISTKILFGSDLPAPQRHEAISLTSYYRKIINDTLIVCKKRLINDNFHHFLHGVK